MTRDEAIARARELAKARGWTWLEPVAATRARHWLLGRRRWTVRSNANSRGCSVRVVFDDATGKIEESGFLPR